MVVVVLVVVVVVVVVGIDRDQLSWLPNWSIRALDRQELGRRAALLQRQLKGVRRLLPHASSATTPLFAAFEVAR